MTKYMSLYFLPHNVIMKMTQDIGKPHTVHSYIQNIHQILVLMFPTHNDVTCVLYLCHAILVNFRIESPKAFEILYFPIQCNIIYFLS